MKRIKTQREISYENDEKLALKYFENKIKEFEEKLKSVIGY